MGRCQITHGVRAWPVRPLSAGEVGGHADTWGDVRGGLTPGETGEGEGGLVVEVNDAASWRTAASMKAVIHDVMSTGHLPLRSPLGPFLALTICLAGMDEME